MTDKRSALDALSAAEKAAVLEELLAVRPDLRGQAEGCAARLLKDASRSAIADDVASALKGLDIDEMNTRAGHRPGFGYVHPVEAADEILDEALQPSSTTFSARPTSAWNPQRPRSRPGSCSVCTTAGSAAPKPCWSTPRTTRPSERQ